MRPPRLVQGVERPVLRAQPIVKIRPAGVAVTGVRVELVVRLPADHVRRVLEMLRHRPRDPFRQQPVRAVGEAVVFPHAPHLARAVEFLRETVRVLPRHPCRHHGGRRADERGDAMLAKQCQRFIKQREIIPALLWFHEHPRKLREPHDIEARLLHQSGICRPAFLRPVFRVVINANSHDVILS